MFQVTLTAGIEPFTLTALALIWENILNSVAAVTSKNFAYKQFHCIRFSQVAIPVRGHNDCPPAGVQLQLLSITRTVRVTRGSDITPDDVAYGIGRNTCTFQTRFVTPPTHTMKGVNLRQECTSFVYTCKGTS